MEKHERVISDFFSAVKEFESLTDTEAMEVPDVVAAALQRAINSGLMTEANRRAHIIAVNRHIPKAFAFASNKMAALEEAGKVLPKTEKWAEKHSGFFHSKMNDLTVKAGLRVA